MNENRVLVLPIMDPWSFRMVTSIGLLDFYIKQGYEIFVISNKKYSNYLPINKSIHYHEYNSSNFLSAIGSLINFSYRIFGNHSYVDFYKSKIKTSLYFLSFPLRSTFILSFLDFTANQIVKFSFSDLVRDVGQCKVIYLDLSPYNYISNGYARKFSMRKDSSVVFVLPSWDNIYKWKTYLFYDKYFVWGQSQMDFLQGISISNERIQLIGGPTVWNLFNSIPSFPRNNNILYTSIGQELFPAEKRFIRVLFDMVKQDMFGKDVKLIVRLHPYDFSEDSEFPADDRLELRRVNNTADMSTWVVPKHFYQDLIDDFTNCKVVICMASSITLDALSFGRTVLNVVDKNAAFDFYSFNHYKPISDSAKVPIIDFSNKRILEFEILRIIKKCKKDYFNELIDQRQSIKGVMELDRGINFFLNNIGI